MMVTMEMSFVSMLTLVRGAGGISAAGPPASAPDNEHTRVPALAAGLARAAAERSRRTSDCGLVTGCSRAFARARRSGGHSAHLRGARRPVPFVEHGRQRLGRAASERHECVRRQGACSWHGAFGLAMDVYGAEVALGTHENRGSLHTGALWWPHHCAPHLRPRLSVSRPLLIAKSRNCGPVV